MIVLDRTLEAPLYIQLYEALKTQIENGSLPDGSKLPSIRSFADELDVSRNTVELAYRQLAAEGYVSSREGSRYRVDAASKFDLPACSIHQGSNETNSSDILLTCNNRDSQPAHHKYRYDFSYGNRTGGSFPSRLWVSLTSEALSCNPAGPAQYSDPFGQIELRALIAWNLKTTRGVNCDPEQVIIQAGTQEAVDALTVLFDASKDVVAMENPGYDGVRRVFENRKFKLVPTDTASTPENFRESLEASNATLAFLTPSNQFPTGRILSLENRLAAIKWAARTGAYLLEDDYCREYRYVGNPIPSLQSLDNYGRVIYLGTLSKMLSPALRISYIVLPRDLLEIWQTVYSNYYCPVPWINQEVLLNFGKQGHWDRYVRKAFVTYRNRRDLIIDSLQNTMGNRVLVIGGEAGLHVLVATNDGRSQEELIQAAAKEDVGVYPTGQYWITPYNERPRHLRECVLVGFSAIQEEDIPKGIHRLYKAWFS